MIWFDSLIISLFIYIPLVLGWLAEPDVYVVVVVDIRGEGESCLLCSYLVIRCILYLFYYLLLPSQVMSCHGQIFTHIGFSSGSIGQNLFRQNNYLKLTHCLLSQLSLLSSDPSSFWS